jgi:phenylpropionate dioxygenase-like ring-hydroxylating dioxygenase large terminal subunit
MSRIKCGYHGWEYNRDGVACMIPGGEYFKPMSPMEFALDRIRVEMLGPLIFVALEEKTPPLREFLGTWMWSRLEYTFSANMRPVATWTVDYECNWKVLVENTLEDYHVTSVHFATVGATPPYKQIVHTFDEKFITYENRSRTFDNTSTHWLTARMRPDAEFTYFQHFSYPSLVFASTPMSSHLHLLIPTSSTTCRMRIALFLPGGGRGLLNRLLCKTLSWPATRLSKKFVEEDRSICNDVQRGIANARFEGVLGCSEERVHAFQEYVLANCDSFHKG